MKKLLLVALAISLVGNLKADVPQIVPMGVKTVMFTNVDLVRQNADWSSAWSRYAEVSQNGNDMMATFEGLGKDEDVQTFLNSAKLDANSVRWFMIAFGKLDVTSKPAPSFAVVIGGDYQFAERFMKAVERALKEENDPSKVAAIVPGGRYDTIIYHANSSVEWDWYVKSFGPELYITAVNSETLVIAGNEKMLNAFKDAYSGKKSGSKRFAPVFERVSDRVFSMRTTGVQEIVKATSGMYDKNAVHPAMQGIFPLMESIKIIDLNFSTIGKEQKLSLACTMKDMASASQCEEMLNTWAMFCKTILSSGQDDQEVLKFFRSLSVKHSGTRVEISAQADMFAISSAGEVADNDEEDEDDIDL